MPEVPPPIPNEFYPNSGPYAVDLVFVVPKEYWDGSTYNDGLAEIGKPPIAAGNVTLEDIWFNKSLSWLEHTKLQMEMTLFDWRARDPFPRELGGLERAYQEVQRAIATVGERQHFTWDTAQTRLTFYAQRFVQWQRERQAREFNMRALIYKVNETSKMMADYVLPDGTHSDERGRVYEGGPNHSQLFTVHPAGMGGNRNVMLTYLYPYMIERNKNVYQWFIPNPGEPLQQHHFGYSKNPANGENTARSHFVPIGFGGYANGGISDYTNPQSDVGESVIGAEPGWRYTITGIIDYAMLLYGYPGDGGIGDSHEIMGHGFGVLCHLGDKTGVFPNDIATTQQTVDHDQQYPLSGDHWGPGQTQQNTLRNDGTFLTPIPPMFPLVLKTEGLTVTPLRNWTIPAAGEGLYWYLDGVRVISSTKFDPVMFAHGGKVKCEYRGLVGLHGSVDGKVLYWTEVDITGVVTPPPDPTPTPDPNPDPPPTVVSLTLTPSNIGNLKKGRTKSIAVTALMSNNTTVMVNAGLCGWSSDNTQIAAVSAKGVVTGIARGATVVRCSYGGKSKACTVIVR